MMYYKYYVINHAIWKVDKNLMFTLKDIEYRKV